MKTSYKFKGCYAKTIKNFSVIWRKCGWLSVQIDLSMITAIGHSKKHYIVNCQNKSGSDYLIDSIDTKAKANRPLEALEFCWIDVVKPEVDSSFLKKIIFSNDACFQPNLKLQKLSNNLQQPIAFTTRHCLVWILS